MKVSVPLTIFATLPQRAVNRLQSRLLRGFPRQGTEGPSPAASAGFGSGGGLPDQGGLLFRMESGSLALVAPETLRFRVVPRGRAC